MIARRAMLAWLAGIGACGGGESGAIALHGDSVPSGWLQVPPAPYTRLPKPAAVLLAEMTGRQVNDYSAPGKLIAQHRPTGEEVSVLWYGGADAVLGTDPADFERDLKAAIRGRVVLVGTYDHPHPPFGIASLAINEAIHRAGKAMSVPVVDVRDLPFVFADPVHPDQATAARFCSRIASQL